MKYHDMVIEASEARIDQTAEKRWRRRFKIRVLSSPAGEMAPEQAVAVECDDSELKAQLRKLDERNLGRDGLIALGGLLASLLLPPAHEKAVVDVRQLLTNSLNLVGQDAGLRLRLRLPQDLAALPWEYVYLDRHETTNAMAGFLSLDARVAIVRHETLPMPPPLTRTSGDIKVIAALASHPDILPRLDLDREESDLTEALRERPGIDPEFLKPATLDRLQARIPGAQVFHFAGHGNYRQEGGDIPRTVMGKGQIALQDQMVDAEMLGFLLQGRGVRLVVLGGCETGRREGVNTWGGIVPALVRCRVPAVVANQYKILNDSAVAFSRQFYCALVGGLPIEQAVSAGRIAAYHVHPNDRDWGVPVLYLRAPDGQLFGGAANGEVRERARRAVESMVQQHAEQYVQIGNIQAPTSIVSAPTSIGSMASGATVFGPMTATVGGVETQETRQSTLPVDRGTGDQLTDLVSAEKISTERTPPEPTTPIPTQTQSAQASMEAISEALRPVLLKLVAELQGDNIRLALLDVSNLSYEVARGSDADTDLISNYVNNLIQLAPTVEPELRNLFSNKQFGVLLTMASFASSPPRKRR